ncbi:cytochrome-c peroxidase [Thalassotalea piscium]|uniref:Cytochrome c peroxidase n=1 Tax=Thalassotalea piscium TaxID=1230533 RepID=A0A7X0TSV2_9GAMM|nr:cytochrome c peroxidase [Thalassotalea piscium]MBB6542521.1 cytochrome c peroxidase [Thalassotalea piscium]
MKVIKSLVIVFTIHVLLANNVVSAKQWQGENNNTLSKSEFTLAKHCPPSFELTPQGVCRLLTQYQFYTSVQNKGLGGTQTNLPPHRDGFTPAQIDLGRYLFFDPALSKDGSISCASCHQPDKGFSDNLDRSIGITGEKIARSAPTLWNVAFVDKFFWDARAKSLEEQALGPLYDPLEMGNTPEKLLATIRSTPTYVKLFAQAYPDMQEIGLEQIYTSLTAFQTSLISLNSRYDRYAHGYHQALTKDEIAGLNVFRSFVARCAECHQPPLFTNNEIAVIGSPEPEGRKLDIGAEKTYNAPKLKGAFKVPTLRNITQSGPYMHSGRYKDLREAVKFYNDGRGNSIPEGEEMLIHWHISEPNLTDDELDLIVTFLGTLTDESLTPRIPQQVPSGLPVIDEKYQERSKAARTQQKLNHNNENAITQSGE